MMGDAALIEKPDTVLAPSIEVSESSFDVLIAQAIDKNVPVETMEKLLAMRRELKAEAGKEAFFTALAEFQSECPVITKSREVKGKDDDGNYTQLRYRYAPLDEIIRVAGPLLKKHGFSYILHPGRAEGAQVAICTLHHIAGHDESSEFCTPVDPKAYMNASAYTYASRYAFCAVTGILTGNEDDDAQGAGEPQQKAQSSSAQSDKPPTITHPTEWQDVHDAMIGMMDDNNWHGDVMYGGRVNHLGVIKERFESITAKLSLGSMNRLYAQYKLLLDTAKKQHDANNQ